MALSLYSCLSTLLSYSVIRYIYKLTSIYGLALRLGQGKCQGSSKHLSSNFALVGI